MIQRYFMLQKPIHISPNLYNYVPASLHAGIAQKLCSHTYKDSEIDIHDLLHDLHIAGYILCTAFHTVRLSCHILYSARWTLPQLALDTGDCWNLVQSGPYWCCCCRYQSPVEQSHALSVERGPGMLSVSRPIFSSSVPQCWQGHIGASLRADLTAHTPPTDKQSNFQVKFPHPPQKVYLKFTKNKVHHLEIIIITIPTFVHITCRIPKSFHLENTDRHRALSLDPWWNINQPVKASMLPNNT